MFYPSDGFAKAPAVMRFKGRYFLYHSAYVPGKKPLRIGMTVSNDMKKRTAAGYLTIHCFKRATDWVNSLYEIVVTGEGDAEAPAPDASNEKLDRMAEAPNTYFILNYCKLHSSVV